MMRVIARGCALAGVLLTGAAQACSSDDFSLVWGTSTDVGLRVRASEDCRFGLKIGRNNHVQSIVVSQAPQHGTITQIAQGAFSYRPSRGYSGPDVLRITATGDVMSTRRNYSGDSTLTYNIQVAP